MNRELIEHKTAVDNNTVYLNAFHGGREFGRCIQLTIHNGTYCSMTFKEAIDLFNRMIIEIEKVEKEYNRSPPWWEQIEKERRNKNDDSIR